MDLPEVWTRTHADPESQGEAWRMKMLVLEKGGSIPEGIVEGRLRRSGRASYDEYKSLRVQVPIIISPVNTVNIDLSSMI